MDILASQFRAARALLDKDQEVVASWVGLDRREVSRWEGAKYKLLSAYGLELQRAYEKNGVEFLAAGDGVGAGVRWREKGRADRLRSAQFRAARALGNFSMRELQVLSNVDRNFLTRLENGKITGLNLHYVRKLEDAFGRQGIELTPEGSTWGVGVRWRVDLPRSSSG